MKTGIQREMCVGGFEKTEKTRDTKKLCTVKQYGIKCEYIDKCQAKQGIRIDIALDLRIFTPIDRATINGKKPITGHPSKE